MERMDIFAVLALMIFAHIVDDYYLQGILAKMKQKSWWEQNAPDEKYKNDYKIALMCHAWSWAIMITIPIFLATAFHPHWCAYFLMAANVIIHAIVDDLKANKKKINLVIDQNIHFAQVIITWLIWWHIEIFA